MRSFTRLRAMPIFTVLLNYIKILTQFFKSSVAPVIKMYPELNANFKCPHSKREYCHKSQPLSTTQNPMASKFVFFYFLSCHVLFPLT